MNNPFKREPLLSALPNGHNRGMSPSADAAGPASSSPASSSPASSSPAVAGPATARPASSPASAIPERGRPGSHAAEPSGLQGGLLLGALSLSFACVALDNTKLTVAVPTLLRELGVEPAARAAVGWIVEANLVVYASLLLLGGALSERLGPRRALLLGLSLFAAASGAAALARSTLGLCAARALVGLGTALMTPASLAALQHGFEGYRRARAIAIWTASFAAAAALGPVLGALLLERSGWRVLMLANVPVAAIAALGVLSQVSAGAPRRRAPLDLLGAALGLCGTAGLMLAATLAAASPRAALAAGATGGAAYALLVAWQRRARFPMLERGLLALPAVRVALLISGLGYFAYAGLTFAVAVDLQLAREHSPRLASLASLPLPLGLLAGTLLAPRLVAWLGARRSLLGALALALSGALAVAVASQASDAWLCLALVPFALGAGASFPTVTELMLGAAPPERAGSAAAVSETAFELGGALGVALLGAASVALSAGGAPIAGAAGGASRAALGAALALGVALLASARLARSDGGPAPPRLLRRGCATTSE
jgi:MFS transporter, DHA2 family, multidrug resistance protein